MSELAQIFLVILLILSGVVYLVDGLAMLLVKPARWDPDTMLPSEVWRRHMAIRLGLGDV